MVAAATVAGAGVPILLTGGAAGANNIVAELRQKAKDLYLQAYALKDTDPQEAVPKFREVMAMTASDDETLLKAKSWIEKIQQR